MSSESSSGANSSSGSSSDSSSSESRTNLQGVPKRMEEGKEGESAGSVPAAVQGQSDLTPASYRIGQSRVTEVDLDKYVEQGLLKSMLRGLCRAPRQEEVPHPKPYEAVVFVISLRLDSDFRVRILWAKFCNASICRSIT